MAQEEHGIQLFGRHSIDRVRQMIGLVQRRKVEAQAEIEQAQARAEEAENLEELILSIFTAYDEALKEFSQAIAVAKAAVDAQVAEVQERVAQRRQQVLDIIDKG